jgi:hypothetical protein
MKATLRGCRIALARPLTLLILALALISPPSASGAFGFMSGSEGFAAALLNEGGSAETRAGIHPFALRVELGLNKAGAFADGDLKSAHIDLPAGLLVNPTAVERCTVAQFHAPRISPYEESLSGESCPDKSQVGVLSVKSGQEGGQTRSFGIFNLTPPHGAPGAFGASPYGVSLLFAPHIREADAGLTLDLEGLAQGFDVQRLQLTLWGTPWAIAHDNQRGNCLNELDPDSPHGEASTPPGPGGSPPFSPGTCTVGDPTVIEPKSYLTAPTGPCGSPLSFSVVASSWQGGGASASAKAPALVQCNHSLSVAKVQLSTETASVGTGLAFNLDVNDGGGILNPEGIARPAIREAIVRLPPGLTLNPSVAAGLGACLEEQFAKEQLESAPGQGCPNEAKVGEVRIDGLLGLPEPVLGSLYVATPYRNPFDSLLALYVVARDPDRGLFVKSVGKVDPDQRTARLTVTFDDLPRLLYTHFEVSLREGQRAMLVSPPACGEHASEIEMRSWAASDPPSHDQSSFAIRTGCPPPGAPPFSPGLRAGSANPNAASYTPVTLQMTRSDSEQEIVSYGAKLPPGLLAKIAGTDLCPEAQIAAAQSRSASAEQQSPSCPASSKIGHILVGGGVGRVLAYAPGSLYLAGPYHGAPLSVVAVTAAKLGPFDLGVVVVRAVPRFDSKSARVSVDASGSDPIPHLLAGIPIHVREIRVYVDRPNFTLNPTSCDPFAFASILGGSGADPFSRADDTSATSTDRFQLLNCSALGFKPSLKMAAKGKAKRGALPSLTATYRPRPGDANLRSATATLPHAFFLEQAHIASICSNAQFTANACPASSVYGHVRARTPLLAETLSGPVYLRSSTHRLPDLVAVLHGLVDVEVAGRIDATRTGLRANFEALPDAPIEAFELRMKGGKKGLVVNSRDLCTGRARALVRFVAQNGKLEVVRPVVVPSCGGKR